MNEHYLYLLNEYVSKTYQGTYTFRLPSEAEWEYACRSANRNDHRRPNERSADLGFRIIASMQDE